VTKLPQVSHERVIRALEHRGFQVLRQGKHVAMTDGQSIVIVPRQPTIKPGTLRQILEAAGLTVEEFRDLL
jgi:predicted RNA binding protein YcfA (HicA-like mRNA interferase family)